MKHIFIVMAACAVAYFAVKIQTKIAVRSRAGALLMPGIVFLTSVCFLLKAFKAVMPSGAYIAVMVASFIVLNITTAVLIYIAAAARKGYIR